LELRGGAGGYGCSDSVDGAAAGFVFWEILSAATYGRGVGGQGWELPPYSTGASEFARVVVRCTAAVGGTERRRFALNLNWSVF